MNTRSRSYSKEIINAVLLGFLAGFSQRTISTVTKIPRTTVREWIYDMKAGRIRKPRRIEHAHHWIIDDKNEELVEGTCKVCFQKKKFLNYTPEKILWMTSEDRIWTSTLVK